MDWFVGRTGYSLFDVWSIVHFCFWVVIGSGLWALKWRGGDYILGCLTVALAWEAFERYAEDRWPEFWLNPESWWNAWVSDVAMCPLGIWFITYALDHWRRS